MSKERPTTESQPAPETVWRPQMPKDMRVERQGQRGVPVTRRYPQVRGGVCEYCGVIDAHTPSQFQYKLCPHYRGMQIRCSYCDETKNPDDVIYHSNMNIAEHPDKPGVLVMWCDSYNCSKAHLERFNPASKT
jgi:hypothetical protein